MRRALIGLCLGFTLLGLLAPLAGAQSTGGGTSTWRDHTTYGSVLVSPVADGARTTLYLDLRTRHVALVRYLAHHRAQISPFVRFVRGLTPARRAFTRFLVRFISAAPSCI